jgi:hypothetical protein
MKTFILVFLFHMFAASVLAQDSQFVLVDLSRLGSRQGVESSKYYSRTLRETEFNNISNSNQLSFSLFLSKANERLRKERKGFQIYIHVDRDSQQFWEIFKQVNLADCSRFSGKRAEAERFLLHASIFDILDVFWEDYPVFSPLYYPGALVYSPSIESNLGYCTK